MDEDLPNDFLDELLAMTGTKGWEYFINYQVNPAIESLKQQAITANDLQKLGDLQGQHDVYNLLVNMREQIEAEYEEQE